MTIHDELILALTQPNEQGKLPLHDIVSSRDITFNIEEPLSYHLAAAGTWIFITPDIVVTITPNLPSEERIRILIELESDMHWDFGDSLRQIKKYKQYASLRRSRERTEVQVIIPKEYQRFVPLYKNEGFPVWLWSATRIWECMRCGTTTEEKRTIKPKCDNRECKSTEQRLKGIKDYLFESTEDEPSTITL